jgi:predicted dehydrogenase
MTLTSYGPQGESTHALRRVDKGHAELLRRVISACRGEAEFEPGLEAAYLAQSVALGVLESIASGKPVDVSGPPS